MSSPEVHFAVGEIAIMLWDESWPDDPTCEVEIIGSARYGRIFSWRDWRSAFDLRYLVVDEAGVTWTCTPDLLRKLPPYDGAGSWSESVWRPKGVGA